MTRGHTAVCPLFFIHVIMGLRFGIDWMKSARGTFKNWVRLPAGPKNTLLLFLDIRAATYAKENYHGSY